MILMYMSHLILLGTLISVKNDFNNHLNSTKASTLNCTLSPEASPSPLEVSEMYNLRAHSSHIGSELGIKNKNKTKNTPGDS